MKVGVFVDINTIYKKVKAVYGKKLNYEKYLDFIKSFGRVEVAIAYGSQVENEGDKFVTYLNKVGFDTKYGKIDIINQNGKKIKIPPIWDSLLTLDVINNAKELDYIVLGVSSKNFEGLVKYLVETLGKKVILFSSLIDNELKKLTLDFDVTTSMLEK